MLYLYLIAPPVSPRTIDFWESRTRITMGIVIVTQSKRRA
jgi:hypothetical protein